LFSSLSLRSVFLRSVLSEETAIKPFKLCSSSQIGAPVTRAGNSVPPFRFTHNSPDQVSPHFKAPIIPRAGKVEVPDGAWFKYSHQSFPLATIRK